MKKLDWKQTFKTRKKLILSVTAIVLVIAIGCGIWYYAGHNSSEPVYVYPFDYVGMTEYWGDSQESYGPVTTDKIQTVYLTDTQTVTEILVQAGDTVKKGDLLMSFDTTLSDLELERKRLDVEKLKLQLEDAQDQLKKINRMKPMVIPKFEEEEDEDENLGSALTGAYKISQQKSYDGSSPEKALICWLNSGAAIDDALFEAIREKAEEYQNDNAAKTPSSASAFFPDFWPDGDAPDETQPEETQPVETKPQETQPAETKPQETQPEETKPQETKPEETKPQETQPEESKPQETQPGETEPEHEHFDVNSYYVVIKVTQGNMSLGNRLIWQGLKVTKGSDGFRFQFSDAVVTDHMMVQTGEGEEVNRPEIDFGSGFTAGQIAEMRADQEKKIKDLEFQIKMAEANYKIMQTEVNDGNVYAEIDGEVVSVLTEEEAKQTMQPVLKVSGGGGFYVEGFVSELEKDKMQIGQEVTVNDWNTGMTYTGTISSMGDFPARDGYWNGMGNPNASYYPFFVFVDGSADLQAGRYVSVMYSAGESENGVYLQKPFLRTEGGRSYVYVLGENGKLEQRYVTTGKDLWGSYTEILEGLTAEDLVAFPYGKNVKPGAKAEEGDMSNLYG
ncbi:MAG: HlyD family efflux transporter periplasmic adaptor subunit [Oscillospiraceae bacterium]|nr:HlyD family efflux transporter periplasmic adaptor subunit [Oscillospiraceae bacterium]